MLRALKITISVSLIAILVSNLDWAESLSDFRSMDPVLVIVAVVLLWLHYPLSALKWRKSLRLHGLQYPFGRLLQIYCVGTFFSNFLPTAIGGDIYRAYRTMENATRHAHAISAVVMERLIGIAALIFLGYLSGMYLVLHGPLVHKNWVAAALILVAAGVLFAWIVWISGSHERIWVRLKKVKRLEPMIDSVRVINTNRQHFPGLIGLSLIYQAVAILTIAVLFAALNLPGKLVHSGFTAVASGIAGVFPLSINGIGVVEGSFVLAAMETRLPYAQAVIVALFVRVFMLVASICFGLLYAIESRQARNDRDNSKS